MKNYSKGFVVPLLIVIAVLVIGAGIYFYSNKKVEEPPQSINSSLKTYTNARYGFEFQYPVNAEIRDVCCQGSMVADLMVYYPSTSTDAADGMELSRVVGLQLHNDYTSSSDTATQDNPNTKLIRKDNLGMNIWISNNGYKDLFKTISSTFKFTK
jgi:hypothetical protein